MANFIPDRAKFLDLARQGGLCFVYREWLADGDTPVSLFAKLGREPYSFLLESVVGGEKWAQYSFAGVKPRAVIRAKGKDIELLRPDGAGFSVAERVRADNPLEYVHLACLASSAARSAFSATTWSAISSACPSGRPTSLGCPTCALP
jgi:anthranilate/para-aminobenzoate synthase component I